MQAALGSIVPAENVTILEVISTGGSDNYPYETELSEPDNITPTTEAKNAPTETLIRFYYPSSLRAQIQSAIDRHDPALYSSGIAAFSLTEAKCSASPSGTCAPGVRPPALPSSMLLHAILPEFQMVYHGKAPPLPRGGVGTMFRSESFPS